MWFNHLVGTTLSSWVYFLQICFLLTAQTIPLFGCTKWTNQKILDACLILNDEDTDVHVVGTSVFSLNFPGPQTYSTKLRKSFFLVFMGKWFRSLLFPKSILKILFWYWQNAISAFLCSEVILLICLTPHKWKRKGYNLQISFLLEWGFSDSALQKEF